MIKAKKLNLGDKIATISLSWGGAGAIPARYEIGKKQLMDTFGLEVVETKHALRSAKWISENPEARANDLMEAFQDPSIKGIFSIIGGDDSIRTLAHTDLDVIRNNPKVFLGYSDTTVGHFACYKAGLCSFYGPSIMAGFAENGGIFPYMEKTLRQVLFSSEEIGNIEANTDGWTTERLEWENSSLQNQKRKLNPCTGWKVLQGTGDAEGHLLGGCAELIDHLAWTDFFPSIEEWKGALLFLETSEEKMPPHYFKYLLRKLAAKGVFHQINGLLLGRPYDNLYAEDYDQLLLQVIREEEGLKDLAIMTRMDFGHTEPFMTIPIGLQAKINCTNSTFSILENAVI